MAKLPRDGDLDGRIFDGTKREMPAPTLPKLPSVLKADKVTAKPAAKYQQPKDGTSVGALVYHTNLAGDTPGEGDWLHAGSRGQAANRTRQVDEALNATEGFSDPLAGDVKAQDIRETTKRVVMFGRDFAPKTFRLKVTKTAMNTPQTPVSDRFANAVGQTLDEIKQRELELGGRSLTDDEAQLVKLDDVVRAAEADYLLEQRYTPLSPEGFEQHHHKMGVTEYDILNRLLDGEDPGPIWYYNDGERLSVFGDGEFPKNDDDPNRMPIEASVMLPKGSYEIVDSHDGPPSFADPPAQYEPENVVDESSLDGVVKALDAAYPGASLRFEAEERDGAIQVDKFRVLSSDARTTNDVLSRLGQFADREGVDVVLNAEPLGQGDPVTVKEALYGPHGFTLEDGKWVRRQRVLKADKMADDNPFAGIFDESPEQIARREAAEAERLRVQERWDELYPDGEFVAPGGVDTSGYETLTREQSQLRKAQFQPLTGEVAYLSYEEEGFEWDTIVSDIPTEQLTAIGRAALLGLSPEGQDELVRAGGGRVTEMLLDGEWDPAIDRVWIPDIGTSTELYREPPEWQMGTVREWEAKAREASLPGYVETGFGSGQLDSEQLDRVRKLRMRLMEQDEVTADDQRKIDLLTDVINGKSDLPDFAVFTFFADYFRDELQKSVDASRERFPDGTVAEGWAHNIDEAFAVLGANVIQRAISSWAGDGNRFGLIALERGVADEFGVPYVEDPRLSDKVKADTDLLYEASPEAWQTVARTIYDNTQAMLAAQGITEALLYRGVGNERTGPFDSPLTSWTVSPNVAQQFAGTKQYQVRVPADRIFGAPMTGLGKSEEAELVLLPSDVPVAEVKRGATGLPRMFDTWLDYDEDIDDALSAKPLLKANAMQEPVTSDDPSFDDYRMQHQPMYGPGAYNLLDGDMMPDDVYDYPERYGSSGSPAAITEMRQQIEAVRGDRDGLVTVYRSVPPDVAVRGDLAWEDGNWVSLSKDYADQHGTSNGGPDWVTMSRQVPAWQVRFAGDDLMEWGWFPNGDRDGDWVTEWGGTPEPVFTSNAMQEQVDAPTTEPLFRVKGGKWQTSDYLLFDQIEDLTADNVEVLLPGSRPGDAPVPYGDYLFRQDYSGLDLDMKNPAAKLNWTYQDVSVDLTTAAAEMTGVADMPGSGWWSDDVDDATTDDYAKALLDEIREQDLTTMTLWSGQPIRLVFGSAEAGDVVAVPLMALSPSRSVAQSYASGDGRKWIQDPTGNLALQWEQGDEKKRADLATVLADPAIVPLLLGDNRTLRTEPATGTDRNLIVQFATAKVAPIRNFEGITSGQYRVKSVQDVPDPDGLAYWDAEAGEFRHTPARLVTVEFVDDLSVQPLDRRTVEREVLLKSNAMAEAGLSPEAEAFAARVDRSVQTESVNRPVSDDWRNTYDARWKFVPEKVRDWALRAGGLQTFDYDASLDRVDGSQVVGGAQLYVDLIDTETTTDFPLWRGDPYIRGRQVGDTFVEIRGFSADRDTARKFSRGGWVYRIEPGDARVVALDLSGDPPRLTGEKEVVVGGTFEVTAVDRDNKVVSLKQVAALPESELARRLRRSGNTIVEDLEQPAVLSVSEPVLTSNAVKTADARDAGWGEAIDAPSEYWGTDYTLTEPEAPRPGDLEDAVREWVVNDPEEVRAPLQQIMVKSGIGPWADEQARESRRRLAALLNALETQGEVMDGTLFRGIAIDNEWEADLESVAMDLPSVGRTVDLPPSGFTTSRDVADRFAEVEYYQYGAGHVSVIYHLAPGAKALELNRIYNPGYSEGEMLVGGRFTVTDRKIDEDKGIIHLYLTQAESIGAPTDGPAGEWR